MICLTEEQCSEWLRYQGILEAPYGRDIPPGVIYLRCAPPTDGQYQLFFASLLDTLGPFTGCLLQLTDWVWDPEYEPDPSAGLREAYGEPRPLIEVPGYLFEWDEGPAAITLGALVLERGWTAYVYPESKIATLLLWEGDLIDVWSDNQGAMARLQATMR